MNITGIGNIIGCFMSTSGIGFSTVPLYDIVASMACKLSFPKSKLGTEGFISCMTAKVSLTVGPLCLNFT